MKSKRKVATMHIDTRELIINLLNISNSVKQIESTNSDDQTPENKHSNLISQTDWDSLTIEDKLKLNNKTDQGNYSKQQVGCITPKSRHRA